MGSNLCVILGGRNGGLIFDEGYIFGYDGTTYLLYTAMSMWFQYMQY